MGLAHEATQSNEPVDTLGGCACGSQRAGAPHRRRRQAMRQRFVAGIVAIVVGLSGAACGQGSPTTAPSAAGTQSPPSRKMAIGMFSAPAGMHQELTNPQGSSGSVPGLAELYQLLDGSLSYYDEHFERQPWLATAVPSTDNGLRQVLPDGTMQTTWHLKPGVTWQDST